MNVDVGSDRVSSRKNLEIFLSSRKGRNPSQPNVFSVRPIAFNLMMVYNPTLQLVTLTLTLLSYLLTLSIILPIHRQVKKVTYIEPSGEPVTVTSDLKDNENLMTLAVRNKLDMEGMCAISPTRPIFYASFLSICH